jgi:AsmA-like C-terminal region/AsmA family
VRLARFLLGGLIGLLVLALAAVWLLPPVLDWNRYRDSFEALASSVLGRPVVIEGPISLSLLPEPELRAAQVGVGNVSGPASGSFTVKAMRMRVALAPLLAGRVEARELVLREPTLALPWPLPPGTLAARPAAWIASFAARVENGTLRVGGMAFTGVDASLATSETGALSITGSASVFGRDWRGVARLTRPGSDGAAGMDVAIDGRGKVSGVGATFSGQLAGDGSLGGHLAGRGPDLSQLIPAPAVPFRAEGRFTAAAGLAAADDLAIEIGGSPAEGAVALRVSPVQRLDIALAASRLDLGDWLPVLLRGTGAEMPVGIDLSVQAALLNGGTLRRLRAGLDLTQDSVAVREVSAILPGEASMRFAGTVMEPDHAAARLDGSAQLDAPDLRTTLHWLASAGFPAVELPAGVPHRATLRGDVTARLGEVVIDKLRGDLDGSGVTGVLAVRPGRPPAMSAELNFDRLDLGQWPPLDARRLLEPFRTAAGAKADLRLSAKQAVSRGGIVQGLTLDVALDGGGLSLRRAEGTVEGVRVSASGTVGEGGRLTDGVLRMDTADAGPLGRLLPARWRGTPALWSGPAALTVNAAGPADALTVHLGLDLADARLEAHPTIDLGSGQWSSRLTLRHPGARRLIASLGLLRPFGSPAMPSWIGEGSLSLLAQMDGAPDRVAANSFDLTAGELRAKGDLALDNTREEPRLTGRIEAERLPLPFVDLRAPDPLPVAVLQGWQASLRVEAGKLLADLSPVLDQLAFTAEVAGGALRIERMTARLGEGTISASAALDGRASPPALALDASLAGAAITGRLLDAPLDLSAGRAAGSLSLTASGFSPAALLATLGGSLHLAVSEGVLVGFDLTRARSAVAGAEAGEPGPLEAALREALSGGATPFDRLDLTADLSRGNLRLRDAALASDAGEVALTGTVGLPGGTVDLRAVLRPAVPNAPEIGLRIAGPIGAPSRTPELAATALWLAERTP